MKLPPGTSPLMPLATTNVALASALHIAGVPWFKNEHGQAVGILNDYSAAKLTAIDADREKRKMRPLNLASLTHDEAVRTAYRFAIAGDVTYQFERTPEAQEIVAGFEAQSKYITATDAGMAVPGVSIVASNHAIGAIVCQAFRERKSFQGEAPSNGSKGIKPYWMQVPPFAVKAEMETGSRDLGKGQKEYYGQGSFDRTEVHV